MAYAQHKRCDELRPVAEGPSHAGGHLDDCAAVVTCISTLGLATVSEPDMLCEAMANRDRELHMPQQNQNSSSLPPGKRWNKLWAVSIVLLPLIVHGCGSFLANQSASLGGDRAGARGTVRILFINNTPYRAAFTYGTYDQLDQTSEPSFGQFASQSTGRTLEPNSESSLASTEFGSFLSCGRAFGVGTPTLIGLINTNIESDGIETSALVDGVEFFEVVEGSEQITSRGKAAALETLIGLEFACEALLIVRLEINDAGPEPFRIDFEIVPSGEAP